MNKFLKYTVAAMLLLSLCLSFVACGRGSSEQPQSQTQQTVPQDSTGTAGGQETENTDATTGEEEGVGSGRPTVESTTDVGSGREEDEPTPPTTQPPTQSEPTTPDDGLSLSINYQQYMALSGEQQQKFFDKHFANDPLGFATWFQRIKQEYDDGKQEIVATGPVDIGDYINP